MNELAQTQVFNSNVASDLINAGAQTGNHIFIYIAVGLVLLQSLFIPLTIWLWKQHAAKEEKKHKDMTDLHNKVIELETEKRKTNRDSQMQAMKNDYHSKIESIEHRLSDVEVNFKHQVEKLVDNSERQSKTMERLFTKFDGMADNFTKILTSKVFNS